MSTGSKNKSNVLLQIRVIPKFNHPVKSSFNLSVCYVLESIEQESFKAVDNSVVDRT